MSAGALIVQRPSLSSLAVPGAMFSPTELQIGPSTSQDEFVRIGKALSAIDSASDLWQCDYSLHAMRRWGQDDGLTLAAIATGLSKFFLKRCARIAERFTPERRYPNLNRNHYRVLLPFDQAQIDAWLPTIADQKRLSAKSLRALAVEKFGEPVTAKQPSKHAVQIRETLWTRLAQHAPSRKTVVLVELILNEWLSKPPDQQAIILASEELRREQKRECSQKRRARKPKAGCVVKEPTREPADIRYQLAKFKREHPEWQGKDAVGTSRNVVTPPDDTSSCPLTPGASKSPKKCTCGFKLVWTTCKGSGTHSAVRGDSFRDRHRAEYAAAEYKACHGWTPFIALCELCSAFHLYHSAPQKEKLQAETGS
jgi:hypothetical protein